MNIIERVEALEKRLSKSVLHEDKLLRAALAEIRGGVAKAKAANGAPTRVIVALTQVADAAHAFRAALGCGTPDPELIALVEEAQAAVAREIVRRKAELLKFAGKMMGRDGAPAYLRKMADRRGFGPPLVHDGQLELYLKSRDTDGADDGDIDDLTATCGVWICIGDSCLCSDWECEGSGPSGQFP